MIPSNNLTATPAFVTGASDVVNAATSYAVTLSGTQVIAENPARLMYTATGTDGKVHMYGLDLTGATTPVPVQIGTLALDGDYQNCQTAFPAQDNALQPSTLWVLIHVNPTATSSMQDCSATAGVYEVIDYLDSPTTAPTVVSVPSAGFNPLYLADGTLAGLIMLQGSNLNFYASKAFTAPASPMIANVTQADDLIDTTSNGRDNIGDDVTFYAVTNATNTQLYRITTAGVATAVYTEVGTGLGGISGGDTNNVYFTDYDSTTFRFLSLGINSGTPSTLYTTSSTPGGYSVLGSNGSVLTFYTAAPGGDSTIQTIPVSGVTTTPTTIATFTGLHINEAFLAESTAGSLSSMQVVVNLVNQNTGVKSTEVVGTTGTVQQALLNNSEFESVNNVFPSSAIQIRGITDTGVSTTYDGGGTFNLYSLASGTVTPMTQPGGAGYTIPASSYGYLGPVGGSASDVIGIGAIISVASGGSTSAIAGLAADSASHVVVPITFPNTAIEQF